MSVKGRQAQPRTTGHTVLIVDDDERLNHLLSAYLNRLGFRVRAVTHPDGAFCAFKADAPDIVILDIMLPDMDGFAVCRKIRETSRVPIIMLTARGDVMDRVVGLEIGADDYLPKPFEPRELAARMQAVLRRQGSIEDDTIRIGPLVINWPGHSAHVDGQRLALTTAEFDLLGLLVRNHGRVLSRERIMDEIRGIDWEAFDRSVDVLVSRLRQKLRDDPRNPTMIRTIRGTGYVFIGGLDD